MMSVYRAAFMARSPLMFRCLMPPVSQQAVDRSWLAGTLWSEATEEASLANLRRSLLHLRRALGVEAARLTAPSPRAVSLDLSGAWVDLLEFDAAVARGDGSSLEQATGL